MDPRRFLALARRLATLTNQEEWRTAVSRAYYAAFHVACELLSSLGFTVPSADRAHGYLWLRLQNCGDGRTESAGNDLKTLRRWRNAADYDLHYSLPRGNVISSITHAATIIQSLDAAAVEPVRSQITTAMKDYEKNVLRNVTWHP